MTTETTTDPACRMFDVLTAIAGDADLTAWLDEHAPDTLEAIDDAVDLWRYGR
jgi:hypothetical protein